MKRLRPFFSYYGSKWCLSIKYPSPGHDHIIEPFAGSACYSLLHYNKQITLFDKYDKICLLWQYLISVSESEILKLPLLEAFQPIPSNICTEAKILIGFWCQTATTYPARRQSCNPVGRCNVWGESVKKRIASQLQYIRHWKIFQSDYQSIQNQEATWFIDPPYQNGGHKYKHSKIDYQNLSDWCDSREGEIIICENKPASWHEFKPIGINQGQKKRKIELFYHRT